MLFEPEMHVIKTRIQSRFVAVLVSEIVHALEKAFLTDESDGVTPTAFVVKRKSRTHIVVEIMASNEKNWDDLSSKSITDWIATQATAAQSKFVESTFCPAQIAHQSKS